MRTASNIARYLLGVIFLVFGLNGFFHFLPVLEPIGTSAKSFGAVFVAHFYVVVFLLHIVAAVLLLANRYVPLALTILGRIVFNIVWIQIFTIRAGLPLAIVVTVLWLAVAYSVRSAFSGIFQRVVLATSQITEKAKVTEMLEDDPGSSSAQMRDSR